MKRRHAIIAILAVPLLLGGCLKRKEAIVLHADGRIDVEHAFIGDGDDLDYGPVRKPDGQGYETSRTVETRDDGDVEHTWTARASYDSAEAMPTSFAAEGDPFAERVLRFRTSVSIREEAGRTYYRFTRVYEPRDWADYRYFSRVCFPPEIEALYEDPDAIPELSLEDRLRLIDAMVRYERMSMQLWADRALAAVAPDAKGLLDAQLDVRDAIAEHCRTHLAPEKVVTVLSRDAGEVEAFAAKAQKAMRALVVERARAALSLSDAQALALQKALLREQFDFDLSHDLGDEDFVVRLEMPGRVVGSNADERDGSALVWTFHGLDLRDRRHVLVATSVVEK